MEPRSGRSSPAGPRAGPAPHPLPTGATRRDAGRRRHRSAVGPGRDRRPTGPPRSGRPAPHRARGRVSRHAGGAGQRPSGAAPGAPDGPGRRPDDRPASLPAGAWGSGMPSRRALRRTLQACGAAERGSAGQPGPCGTCRAGGQRDPGARATRPSGGAWAMAPRPASHRARSPGASAFRAARISAGVPSCSAAARATASAASPRS